MFELDELTLSKMGASITTREIKQQPDLWREVWEIYKEQYNEIEDFLTQIVAKHEQRIRVVFTGAGTSQYVGDTILPYLKQYGESCSFIFESAGTTEIVSNPRSYLFKDDPTILVSFARSGNSPESVGAVQLANQLVDNVYHITITCAPDGKLATQATGDTRNLLLLMPERANDAGFAMTGSYSCMALMALMVFDRTDKDVKEQYIATIISLGTEIITREQELSTFLDGEVERVVYLGSGALAGLAREAQLKILELTAGKIVTAYDSSMGFRHGPKSVVNDKTVVFVFVNNHPYIQKYDVDILNEMTGDQIAKRIVGVLQKQSHTIGSTTFVLENGQQLLPDAYLSIVDVVFAQTISLLASIKVGNTPDTPSPSGTVNRVVKGVVLYPYSEKEE